MQCITGSREKKRKKQTRVTVHYFLLWTRTCSYEFSLMGARFLEDGLVVLGHYTAFSNNQKMVSILHKELARKVEKLMIKHMRLEVMQPKIKNKSELPAGE